MSVPESNWESRLALSPIYRCFGLLGLLQPTSGFFGSHRWRWPYRCYATLLLAWQLLLLPACFALSYKSGPGAVKMDIGQMLTSLQVAFNACGLPSKIIAMLWYMPRLLRANAHLATLDTRAAGPAERRYIGSAVRYCHRIFWFYLGSYCFYAFTTFVCALLLHQPPYSLYLLGLDWRRSTRQLAAQALIEYIMITWTCLHQVTDDVYAVIYIYILRIHVQLLAQRVRQIGHSTAAELNVFTAAEQVAHELQLRRCIEDHQTLLSVLEAIKPVISSTMFVQFVVMALVLCTTLVNIFIFADTTSQIASAYYMVAVPLQISTCCYQATCLLQDNEDLALAIFQCHWIGQSARFRKLLLFFLQRAQQPMTLTAKNLFPINLSTNSAIIKFSFSLYTLIKKLDLEQHLAAD